MNLPELFSTPRRALSRNPLSPPGAVHRRGAEIAQRGAEKDISSLRPSARSPRRVRTVVNPSRDRDLFGEVNVLNGVEEADAFVHRALESLAARNQPHAAAALVDDGRADGL